MDHYVKGKGGDILESKNNNRKMFRKYPDCIFIASGRTNPATVPATGYGRPPGTDSTLIRFYLQPGQQAILNKINKSSKTNRKRTHNYN